MSSEQEPDIRVRRRRILATVAVWVGTLAAGAGVSRGAVAVTAGHPDAPGHPEPQAEATSFDAAFWQRQDQLGDLRAWVAARPGIDTSGFIDFANNTPVEGEVTLFWRGPANELQHQIKDEGRRRGITVSVEQRRYTNADIDLAVQKILNEEGRGVLASFTISGVGRGGLDFDGVILTGIYRRPLPGGHAGADAALAAALTASTGVAVRVEYGEIIPL